MSKNARILEENIEEKRGGELGGAGWGRKGKKKKMRGANRASFTKGETHALDEGRERKGRLNKDAAKSETADSTGAPEEEEEEKIPLFRSSRRLYSRY